MPAISETVDRAIVNRWTRAGTPYQIAKWACPSCGKEKSTLYIDGELCHGDGWAVSKSAAGEWWEGCITCWLEREAAQRAKKGEN